MLSCERSHYCQSSPYCRPRHYWYYLSHTEQAVWSVRTLWRKLSTPTVQLMSFSDDQNPDISLYLPVNNNIEHLLSQHCLPTEHSHQWLFTVHYRRLNHPNISNIKTESSRLGSFSYFHFFWHIEDTGRTLLAGIVVNWCFVPSVSGVKFCSSYL